MGLFLAVAGIGGATEPSVENALAGYASQHGMRFEHSESVSMDGAGQLVMSAASAGGVSVLFPSDFMEWDDCAAHLSKSLKAPVFSFHIHDGDLWMYVFFVSGAGTDWFNPLPEYWDDDISEEERRKWAGRASMVSEHWPGVRKEQIEKYLVHWDLDKVYDEKKKAYQDDEHHFGEDWQLTDFMRRLGLKYPMDGQGKAAGKVFRFSQGARPERITATPGPKPWWKFWR